MGASDFNYPDEPGLAPYSNYREDLDIIAPGGMSVLIQIITGLLMEY